MLKPKILFSRCFFDPVRYNGGLVIDDFIEKLKAYVDCLYLCPEVEIGLGIPRLRIIITQNKEGTRLIQPETGIDLTDKMLKYTHYTVKKLDTIDGAILKAKSPSCGVSSAKLYKDGAVIGKTDGFFTETLKKTFPLLPLEDEGRLKERNIRNHFLTRVFALCEFRNLSKNPTELDLVKFHTKYKYLLMTYSQKYLKVLGKIVSDGRITLEEKIFKYSENFAEAFRKKPDKGKHINTLMHMFGHISKYLNHKERGHFLELMEKYRKNIVELRVLIELLKSFAYRFENEYLLLQKYLEPFPEDLNV